MKNALKYLLKPAYQFYKNKNQREFYRLGLRYGDIPRYQPRKINFLNYQFTVPDCPSFIWQFKDIFVEQIYNFSSAQAEPIIYDCGANIGTSVVYVKKIFPQARIKAFEADPKITAILKANLAANQIKNVQVIQKAVWINNEKVGFSSQGADGGSLLGQDSKIAVPAVRLKELIVQEPRLDMLKMDIEGSEVEIMVDCAEVLKKVANIFIEYHSWKNQPQDLSKILAILSANNFRYHIHSLANRQQPFINKGKDLPMDLQLNIFAYRGI